MEHYLNDVVVKELSLNIQSYTRGCYTCEEQIIKKEIIDVVEKMDNNTSPGNNGLPYCKICNFL